MKSFNLFFRFKTRNTYKRHLKTRHGKVLTITGELLHLSEEDSKKVRTKNRRKKQDNSESIINETAAATKNIQDSEETHEFPWDEQQVCNDGSNESNGVQQCMDNAIWMYQNQPGVVIEENYTEIEDKSTIDKTEFNETEIETNFESNEVVIAQTDSDGTLHFENYDYAQETVYPDGSTIEYSSGEQEDECEIMATDAKHYESHEETVKYQECTENYSTEPIFTVKTEPEEGVFVINNEEIITSDQVEHQVESTSTQTENVVEADINSEEQTLKIIPYQVKVCENNGAATLQLLKNSKIALLGNKTQSINLIQNGKQHTILLLASGDNNLLEIDNSLIEGSKPLPVIAVPAD